MRKEKRPTGPVARFLYEGKVIETNSAGIKVEIDVGGKKERRILFARELKEIPSKWLKKGQRLLVRVSLEFLPKPKPITKKQAETLAKKLKRRYPKWGEAGRNCTVGTVFESVSPQEPVDPATAESLYLATKGDIFD